ncbi:DUF4183 domain-containing protein [bacterium LRH843]|nr:DUF4183 domain-containing protein [bacterium LRH843]
MPAELIKLFIVGNSQNVDTQITPDVQRFVATVTADMITTNTVIPATAFSDDSGTALAADGLPDIAADTDVYFNVYINGVLQQGELSTLTPAELTIDTVDILVGTPVVLEVVQITGTTDFEIEIDT